MAEFVEWHTILSSQIERDADFRELLVAVWGLDTPQASELAGGVQNVEIARKADRNAREMYRHDFHRVTFGNQQILQHDLPEWVEQKEMEPKIITNPALRKRVIDQQPPGHIETDQEICQRVSNKIVSRGAKGI
jgi:hypothetical protein